MTNYIRSDKVPEADEPKTWNDLADPKYKGKMVIGDPSFTSLLVSVVGMMSKERGWGFYEKLRANDTMVVQGNQQASDMLKRGERLIAVGALDSYAAEDRAAGHPMKTLYPSDGVFVIPSPTSVVKGGPNPNAAKLLAEFIISDEVQKIFPADGGFSARSDIRRAGRLAAAVEPENPAGGLRLHREGSPAHQEALQRDISVRNIAQGRRRLAQPAASRPASAPGPRPPSRRCSRSSSR